MRNYKEKTCCFSNNGKRKVMKKRRFFISDIHSLRNLRYILAECDIPSVRYVPAVHEKELKFMKILLASKSPRRRELLLGMGLEFDICSPQFDEDSVAGFSPDVTVEKLSLGKAMSASRDDAVVIGSDTVVALDGVILGKPADEADAVRMLKMLSGRKHYVYTGVALVGGGKSVVFHEKTAVQFRHLTDEDIAAYVASGEPMDKAGAYGIQGKGALLVSGIEGDYFTVVGLPVCRVAQALKNEFGIDCLKGFKL